MMNLRKLFQGDFAGSSVFLSIFFLLSVSLVHAQSGRQRDSIRVRSQLSEVEIKAFELTGKLSDRPAAISYLSPSSLERYNSLNIVSAMNAIPGVRMEQRSPASYRINIRGSSLRSPFGIRNVKVYYNGIPFTDPGGNTYLNQLTLEDLNTIEVIRGPAGSMYGAGTGGVLLINSPLHARDFNTQKGASVSFGAGSFGLMKEQIGLKWGEKENRSVLSFSNMESDGYRDHTAMHHQTFSYETSIKKTEKQSLEAFFRYANLYYQTPGALTEAQFNQNPKAARPAVGAVPSAEESKASVHQKAFLAGISHTYLFSQEFKNTFALYGAYTDFTNPTFLNYEYRKEPHFGGRTVFEYDPSGNKVVGKYFLGGELQQGYTGQQDYETVDGKPGSVMTLDRINEWTGFVFGQADFVFQKGWELNAGFSLNFRKLHFDRSYPVNEADFTLNNDPVLAPRVILSKKIYPDILIYGDVSRGFSPPTVAEILPSTTELNRDLQAEKGMQYEIGSKGYLFGQRLFYDADFFLTRLNQSITSRKDAGGADYFVNAGNALQKGFELALNGEVYRSGISFIRTVTAWSSLTLFDFKYKDFETGGKDYSGKNFPGSPKTNVSAGLDLMTKVKLNTHLTYQHTSRIPLNDDNTVYGSGYDLLGLNLTYKQKISARIGMEIAIGGDNLLDKKYSLGDDLNAFGGRYYNLAPGINFYGNLKVNYFLK